MATFAALQSRVSARLKDPNNEDISAADVAAVINDAIKHWAKKKFWFNEFEETVALTYNGDSDDRFLTLVTNVDPQQIFKENGMVIDYAQTRWPVTKVSSENYDAMNVEGRGIPFAWTYRNDRYELYWYPDQAYSLTVRGLKKYADLSADGDSNDFTDEAFDLIMYEALSRLYAEFRQDDAMEGYYTGRAKDQYVTLRNETNRRKATGRVGG